MSRAPRGGAARSIGRAALMTGALLLVACGSEDAGAPEAASASGLDADPWTPLREPALRARIALAREQAGASGRRVLLQFVADWCEDCHEVVRLSRAEPSRSLIEQRYRVVFVEVGRFDRHRELIDAHEIDRIATLVVLDPQTGQRIAKTTLEPITGGQRGLTSEALARWLRDPSPG